MVRFNRDGRERPARAVLGAQVGNVAADKGGIREESSDLGGVAGLHRRGDALERAEVGVQQPAAPRALVDRRVAEAKLHRELAVPLAGQPVHEVGVAHPMYEYSVWSPR